MINIAINGLGRIGRCILRAVYEEHYRDKLNIVAVNNSATPDASVHLINYDSIHGRFPFDIGHDGKDLKVNGDHIEKFNERDPSKLPWGDFNVDIVLECTGQFRTREKAGLHLQAGAKKVLISAPADDAVDATVVYGVNHSIIKSTDRIISNASCTTNCLVPLVKPLHDALGIEAGLMLTVHAYTSDQSLTDNHHKDLRRARAAALSMIPTKTGAAAAIGQVLPELAGKLDGYAVRVPIANVSFIDFTFSAKRPTSKEEVNAILQRAARNELKGILDFSTAPLVSCDFNHTTPSATVDAELTRVIDRLVKVSAWYDNEWAFSCRMLDTALAMARV